VLGWSAQIFTILNELIVANENQRNARIVVLADKDKVEMEDEIRERVEVRGRTRIICRHGSPIDPNDLEITSPHAAKSIIVLPPENNDPDTDVIRTVLAITNNPNRRAKPYHIVSEMLDLRNRELAEATQVDDSIVSEHLISLMLAQLSENAELLDVFTDIFDPEGAEIYLSQ
jgi:voltage-gated potassium channel Kch